MLPELLLSDVWQNLKRLLVVCFLDDEDTLSQLIPVLNLFQSSVPSTAIQLLVLKDKQYGICPLNSQLRSSDLSSSSIDYANCFQLIQEIKAHAFDAAIMLTAPAQSPFSLAYLCYLAGVPIRIGQSQEFGGGVLSHCIKPPLEKVSCIDYNLHLLHEAGFPKFEHPKFAIA